ncbi:hypothetical protein SK128_017755 [Halocaridina rubra]|uniref:Uncharacterized protein n=1 Tax=Halocaridina rubra TaxID=373956 RepID=A0AAN8WY70_HALRR
MITMEKCICKPRVGVNLLDRTTDVLCLMVSTPLACYSDKSPYGSSEALWIVEFKASWVGAILSELLKGGEDSIDHSVLNFRELVMSRGSPASMAST